MAKCHKPGKVAQHKKQFGLNVHIALYDRHKRQAEKAQSKYISALSLSKFFRSEWMFVLGNVLGSRKDRGSSNSTSECTSTC